MKFVEIYYGIIWLTFFLVIGVIIVGIGSRFEKPSNEALVVMYIVGFLLGTMVTARIKMRIDDKYAQVAKSEPNGK